MKAPDKLYIICDAVNNRDMTVATEKPMFSDDICYIRKDALLEWADKFRHTPLPGKTIIAYLFDKINSL